MPLLKLQTSVDVPPAKREPLLKALSKVLTDATGKPEAYMMLSLESAAMMMAGRPGPTAYLDIRGIGGFNKSVNAAISKGICDALQAELGISPDRVYITFTDVPAQNWGWKGGTFG